MSDEGQGMIAINEQEVLQKIAYCYYEKFKDMGEEENHLRDWHYAEKALAHLKSPCDMEDFWWNFHEENYNEFRIFLE